MKKSSYVWIIAKTAGRRSANEPSHITDNLLGEIPAEYIPSILKKQIKDFKRMGRTEPYHSRRKCKDWSRCPFHERKRT